MAINNLLTEQLKYTGENKIPTKINLYSYNKESISCHHDIQPSALKELKGKEAVNWIQVTGLQDTDILKEVFQQFSIDFLTRQDILNSDHLPKIEEHDRYNVIILKRLHKNKQDDYDPLHLCIIQGQTYIITFTEKESDIFNDIVSALHNDTLRIRQKQSDYLLSVIINEVISNYMSVITQMEDELEDLEESLIIPDSAKVPAGIESIQQFRKNYRIIKKSVFPLKEHFNKLFHTDNELFNESQRPFFNDINDHLLFVLQTMESCRDLITAIADLYLSQNEQRLNDIMKQLTIVSTIFIPLTFLAGIWGMNFEWMPELSWKHGYLMAWGVMLAMGMSLFFFFRHKKW